MLTAVALLAVAVSAASASAASAEGYRATIRRTSYGIPHIKGPDFGSVGYGYGYAFAQDNICTIAQTYVTVRGERSRYFGPDASYEFRANGSTANNLNSDFFYKRIIGARTIEKLLAKKPPDGPKPEIREGVRGYVAGYNRYLRDTGVNRISDPTCRGKPWVKPISEIDAYRRFYQLALLASGGVAIDGIAGAQPPGPSLGAAPARTPRRGDLLELKRRLPLGGIGSNAYGLGREATSNGRGMMLGNPHFPWDGSERFYQAQLTIPGKVNVTGASLFGVPIILIGHTRNLAWSHTVSTGFRFTPFEVRLQPGSPRTYLVDGKPQRMKAETVTVKARGKDGKLEDRTRTLYSTKYGPIFTSLLGLPLFPWTPLSAYAMGDANAPNFRYLNHFFDVNQAQSTPELDRILKRDQGVPWVNTIATDSKGRAYYADISVTPNVTDAKAARCDTALGIATFNLLRLPVLDGSRSSCDWGRDRDAIQPGTFGPSNLPSLFRKDYVTNSNDSYWLSNPNRPLTGFNRIIGDERTPRSLRTRLGLVMIEQRLNGKDGRPGRRFTLRQLQDTVFNNRQYAGELWRGALVRMCRENPVVLARGGPVDVRAACPVLARWDLRDNLDSRGALLFRRFASRALAATVPLLPPPFLFANSFNVQDPVHTPNGLSTGNPLVKAALGDAVKDLRDSNIPLDAPLRGYQYERRGGEKIPIHGGPGTLGVFNAINVPFVKGQGYPNVPHGSSFVYAASFNDGCPESRSILTYSQSTNPRSPHFADQTRLFSRKRWVDMRFCENEIAADPNLEVTQLDDPQLKLRLGYRRGRTRRGRRGKVCARSRVRARVLGRDGPRVRRVLFVRGRRRFRVDRRAPFRRTVYRPRRGRAHRVRIRARVRMKDGRVVRLGRSFRACGRRR